MGDANDRTRGGVVKTKTGSENVWPRNRVVGEEQRLNSPIPAEGKTLKPPGTAAEEKSRRIIPETLN